MMHQMWPMPGQPINGHLKKKKKHYHQLHTLKLMVDSNFRFLILKKIKNIDFDFIAIKAFAKWMRLFFYSTKGEMPLNQFWIANTRLDLLMVSELHLSWLPRLH